MKLSIVAVESSLLLMQEPKRNKPEGHRFQKEHSKGMIVQHELLFKKVIERSHPRRAIRKSVFIPNSDISRMLDDLLEANLIELPIIKHFVEANQMDNPNYCKHHRLINHPV
jgi:hypothetical protein